MYKALWVSLLVTACGGSWGSAPDAPRGSVPITCSGTGAGASGSILDDAGLSHTFGPMLTVTWLPAGATYPPPSILFDDGATKIRIYWVGTPANPPAVGDYTDDRSGNDFTSSWFNGSVIADSVDIHVDASPGTDTCWGGRFDVVYGFDKGGVQGEITGWWAQPPS